VVVFISLNSVQPAFIHRLLFIVQSRKLLPEKFFDWLTVGLSSTVIPGSEFHRTDDDILLFDVSGSHPLGHFLLTKDIKWLFSFFHLCPAVVFYCMNSPFCICVVCGLVVRIPGCRPRGPGFDSRRYQIFWVAVGLEQGPLRLVNINEELLKSKISDSILENWDYQPWRFCRADHVIPLYPQKLALIFAYQWRLLSQYSSLAY
jgi:hypothetical protein